MSTTESNITNQPVVCTSASSSSTNSGIPPPLLLPTATPLTATPSIPLPSPPPPTPFYDDRPIEKFYKKEKQILLEFDQLVKDIRFQLNEQLKCLEQRIETQLSILTEIQEYFRRRADVELDYAKNLDNLHKQIGQKHRAQKAKRETWIFQSIYKLWDTIVQDTRTHVKYHTIMSDICGKYMSDKFNEIAEDTRRMFTKCKSVGLASHDDIYKVLNELKSTLKTYHQYQNESKQAEQKLRNIQQQVAKIKSIKKQKAMSKRVEKRQMKYTETKVKAFKARNDYLMTIESVNAALQKYCSDDVPDLIDCMNFGFHTSIAKCIQMYLSAQENIKRGRQATIDTLNRAIGDLDTVVDKQKYLECYAAIFTITKLIKFEPRKGDEVSTVNAQVLIRDEMQSRFIQMQNRLAGLKTENDEIFKTIEATEQSLMEFINTKNSDVSDLFKDLNLPQNTSKNTRKEIEDYYVEKFKQYTLSSNLITRLQARHDIMQKALGAASTNSLEDKNLIRRSIKPKQIGRAPILGRPRLFGGKLLDYIQVTEQHIPLIISSCVSAINRLGLHNQGIFRVPGAQIDINQFKEAFEKGEDPLVNVTSRDMNSVAGVIKLYFRELKEPLFVRDMFDSFISCTVDIESEDKCVENLCQIVKLLPHPIFIVMRYFFAFLNHLSEYSDENMMDASNLASCLAPTLMPIPEDKDQVQYLTHTIELIRTMIVHHEEIFPVNDDGPVYEKFAITIPIDGDEDEDDEGISERLLRRSPSDDASQDSDYCTEDFNLLNETDV
jgi:SLIT-ROBO Rho GTPase activating protein